MAVIKVPRPKLGFGEKIYLTALCKGFLLTLRHAVKSLIGKSMGAKDLASPGLGVTMSAAGMRKYLVEIEIGVRGQSLYRSPAI